MKTIVKRAATLAWICAVMAFGAGTLIFSASAVLRLLTPPTIHPLITMVNGEIVREPEVRRPTMIETLNGMGIQHDFLALATGVSFIAVFLGACVVPWWYVRRSPAGEPEDSQSMQELHRLAERLTCRLDSLETILLDPARQVPEWDREHL